jgi:hypothetical protein
MAATKGMPDFHTALQHLPDRGHPFKIENTSILEIYEFFQSSLECTIVNRKDLP